MLGSYKKKTAFKQLKFLINFKVLKNLTADPQRPA